jgi:hypothetical protein
MIKGLKTEGVRESQIAYIQVSEKRGVCLACALGCALIGKYNGDYLEAYYAWKRSLHRSGVTVIQDIFAHLLDIPIALAVEVEVGHLSDESIEDIAKWLKSSEGEADHV